MLMISSCRHGGILLSHPLARTRLLIGFSGASRIGNKRLIRFEAPPSGCGGIQVERDSGLVIMETESHVRVKKERAFGHREDQLASPILSEHGSATMPLVCSVSSGGMARKVLRLIRRADLHHGRLTRPGMLADRQRLEEKKGNFLIGRGRDGIQSVYKMTQPATHGRYSAR